MTFSDGIRVIFSLKVSVLGYTPFMIIVIHFVLTVKVNWLPAEELHKKYLFMTELFSFSVLSDSRG